MKKKRLIKLLLIFLVFAFFTGIAIVAIIIARGGVRTNDGVTFNTGSIKIVTSPQDLNYKAYINNEPALIEDNQIKRLTTGTYRLKLEVQGFAIWEKDLKVNAGIVTEVLAKLYPAALSLGQFTKTNVDKVFFSPKGDYLYYVVKNSEFGNEKGIWRLKLTPNDIIFGSSQNQPVKIANVLEVLATAITKGTYTLIPSPDNNKVIFDDVESNLHYLLNVNGSNDNVTSLESTLGFSADAVSWFNGSNSLIIQDGQVLFEENLTNKLKILINYLPGDKTIYSNNNNEVIYWDNKAKTIIVYKNQTAEPLKLTNIQLPPEVLSLNLAAGTERFIVIGTPNGYKYLDTEKSLLKDIPDIGTLKDFASDGRSALFVDRFNKVTAYTVTEVIALNTVEIKTIPTDITLDQSDLLFFSPQGQHFLYFAGKNTTISAYDKDGGNKMVLLSNNGILPYMNFDSLSANLFVLLTDELSGQKVANIYKIDLLTPKK